MNEMDMDMDIMEIVDMMEEAIEKASAVPLTGKVMIDKGELLDYIQEIRLVYPDELKEHAGEHTVCGPPGRAGRAKGSKVG